MILLLNTAPPESSKVRNKTGIKAIFDRALARGQKVTLEEAIAILRRDW
jgi:hypothetical protein